MTVRALAVVAALGVSLLPRVALADCPDGWFCDDAPGAARPAPQPATPAEPARPNAEPPAPREEPSEEADEPPPPPHRRARIVLVDEPDYPPPPPPRFHRRHRQELGLNFHLDAGVMGAGSQDDSFLGGAGLAFRLRPLPAFAVDLGLELVSGNDYDGNDRLEQAFVANALVFLNPRDRVQVFLLGGFNLGGAEVRVRHYGGMAVPARDENYSYVGAQLGLGLEWRVTRHVAITSDFQLFVRGRTDAGPYSYPEYVDPSTHLATNTSGGGLFRLGTTFYF